jgi:hypothetical protein
MNIQNLKNKANALTYSTIGALALVSTSSNAATTTEVTLGTRVKSVTGTFWNWETQQWLVALISLAGLFFVVKGIYNGIKEGNPLDGAKDAVAGLVVLGVGLNLATILNALGILAFSAAGTAIT